MKCTNQQCGREVMDDWEICPYCKTEVSKGPVCPQCGMEVELSWAACPGCRTDLGLSNSESIDAAGIFDCVDGTAIRNSEEHFKCAECDGFCREENRVTHPEGVKLPMCRLCGSSLVQPLWDAHNARIAEVKAEEERATQEEAIKWAKEEAQKIETARLAQEQAEKAATEIAAMAEQERLKKNREESAIAKVAAEKLDVDGLSAIHHAAMSSDLKTCQRYVKLEVDWDLKDAEGETPLHKVCADEDGEDDAIEVLEFLVANGADVNTRNPAGQTPFFKVSCAGLIGALVKAGGDINALDKTGLSPYASWIQRTKHDIICDGREYQWRNEVSKAFEENGVDVGWKGHDGKNLLHLIAENCGIYGCWRDKDSISEAVSIFSRLIDAGLDPYEQDGDGNTALHRLVDTEYFTSDLIEDHLLILDFFGWDKIPKIENNRGQTFYDLSKARGHKKWAKYLKKACR